MRNLLKRADPFALQQPEIREGLLPTLLRKAHEVAEGRRPAIVAAARGEMSARLDHEIERLRALRRVNPTVRAEEIDLLVEQKAALDQRLQGARLRLDAIRLIQRGPQ